MTNCRRSPTGWSPRPRPASRSRRTCRAAARPRSASTRARSSTSCRRRARASASGSSATAAPASPTPARSIPPPSTRCSPRRGTTSRSAPSTSGPAWPSPTASSARHRSCGTRRSASFPTERKIELAKELERLTLAADPRVRVDDSNYADAWGEAAVATTTGIRGDAARERLLRQRQHPRRRRRRDADRVRVQRRPRAGRVRPRPGGRGRRRPGDPAARGDEAADPAAHGRARSVRDGPVPRRDLGDGRTARAW